jgi:hypothetical protein
MAIERAVYTREEIQLNGEEARKIKFKQFLDLYNKDEDLLDEDGYPTDHALNLIEIWPWDDPKGWFEFIKSIWHQASWGWNVDTKTNNSKSVLVYNISTGGWSGNESIIGAMQLNDFMWWIHWVQSRRGGHFIFEVKDRDE